MWALWMLAHELEEPRHNVWVLRGVRGWLLGWESAGARASGRDLRTALAAGAGVLLFVLARLSDGLVHDGQIGGALAGWLPLAAALGLALLVLGWRGR